MELAALQTILVMFVLVVIIQLVCRGHTQQRPIRGKAKGAGQGRTCRPDCPACQAEGHNVEPPPRPVCRQKKKPGRPRSVNTDWHFCPDASCSHHGWVGLGNVIANGHPNGSRWRQLHCTVCKGFFMETEGTIFYRSPLPSKALCQIIQGLAEGWNLHSVARVFKVDPDTVKGCLVRAAEHAQAVSGYLIRNLHLSQVQVDELWALVQSWGEEEDADPETKVRRSQGWVWAGIDPISKLVLATLVGGRNLQYAQLLIHTIAWVLAPGVVPLFLSDQLPHYTTAILTHFGHWVAVPRRSKYGPTPKPRWEPLPELNYAQVVKRRVKGRVVAVTRRVVFGSAEAITAILNRTGHKINTAFIERVNLTLRAHVPALGRKVLSFAKSTLGLAQQVSLTQAYYNFCLPHRALRLQLPEAIPTKGNGSPKQWLSRTPAMAAGITTHPWSMEELLLFRIPPWSQEAPG